MPMINDLKQVLKEMANFHKGACLFNGRTFMSMDDVNDALSTFEGMVDLSIPPQTEAITRAPQPVSGDTEYWVTVKAYMTKPGTPEFDFQTKFNKDVPMPLRTMRGKILGETNGMYKMELRGGIQDKPTINCIVCGKTLKNEISQYYGVGPECGGHYYETTSTTDEDIKAWKAVFEKQFSEIKWSGWVIKSAILKMEEIDNG